MSVPDGSETAPVIAVEWLRVGRDRVSAGVRVNPRCAMTTPAVAHRIVRIRPDLPRHACVNGRGPAFGAVVAHTPTPHLLEHLVIDLQVEAARRADGPSSQPGAFPPPVDGGVGRVFTGVTCWTDRAACRARVEVSYVDDLSAIAAFRDAAELLNAIGAGPDWGNGNDGPAWRPAPRRAV